MTFEPHPETTANADATVRVRTPGDLLAMIPYLLGFHPRDSLVVVIMGSDPRPTVRGALRMDLPAPEGTEVLAEQVVQAALAHGCAQALLTVVAAEPPGGSPPRRDVVDAVHRHFTAAGVSVHPALWVPEVVGQARWHCYDTCGCTGVVPDPSASPMAAASVASGQVTYADRAELEALVAPGEPEALERRSAHLDAYYDSVARAEDPDPMFFAVDGIALLLEWVLRAEAGRLPTEDDDLVALAVALADPLVRDAALGFALGERADAAQRLWQALVTALPAPEAAEPAVLLAFSALVRGHGAMAGIALQRAQQAWPGHRLSRLCQVALDSGLDPERARTWIQAGASRAAEILSERDGPDAAA